MSPENRDELGREVRNIWITWAKEQPNPKPSWLITYDELDEPSREVDRRIGEKLFISGMIAGVDVLKNYMYKMVDNLTNNLTNDLGKEI